MIKILLTGDIHLGRNYSKEAPDVASKYVEARIQALKNAVDIANREYCNFFVIAGDLYDKVRGISVKLHEQVCRILNGFSGEAVLILPGNHDYYAENDILWKKFEEYSGPDIRVFKENKKYQIGNTVFYPCICHDKHSQTNSLGWISEESERRPEQYHIGIAHGSIDGLSYDKNQEYYAMSEQELLSYNMDLWLVGHTHIAYPFVIDNTVNQRIFNAGTPQQTDHADNSVGEVFILEIDENKHITAKKERTGSITFTEKQVILQHGQALETALQFPDLTPEATSLRVVLSGTASTDDYDDRNKVYENLRNKYIEAKINDEKLQKEITSEEINKATIDGSIINQLLNSYMNDLELLNLAYDLMISCKEGN